MTARRANVRITGRVQGVWFRQSTKQAADALGVRGWVRNCADGAVEAVFEGAPGAVQSVIDWCQQGPEQARVEQVAIDWQVATGEFRDFRVLR